MQNLLYTIAIIFIALWLIGFLVLNLGSIIHILLIVAVIAVLLNVNKGEEI